VPNNSKHPTFWKRHAYRLPHPWRWYAGCHGTLRACHWFPRWRDAIVCAIRGHVWDYVVVEGESVMCSRCAAGPVYADDDWAGAWPAEVTS
jgi:hypothetical protein